MGEARSQVFENREVRLMQVRSGALIQKDGKNEGRSGDVHEKTGEAEIQTDRCRTSYLRREHPPVTPFQAQERSQRYKPSTWKVARGNPAGSGEMSAERNFCFCQCKKALK